jgi:Domain of Unknown Function (DUF1259)
LVGGQTASREIFFLMLGEQPRLFFVHSWVNDDAVKLAKGPEATLEKISIAMS